MSSLNICIILWRHFRLTFRGFFLQWTAVPIKAFSLHCPQAFVYLSIYIIHTLQTWNSVLLVAIFLIVYMEYWLNWVDYCYWLTPMKLAPELHIAKIHTVDTQTSSSRRNRRNVARVIEKVIFGLKPSISITYVIIIQIIRVKIR